MHRHLNSSELLVAAYVVPGVIGEINARLPKFTDDLPSQSFQDIFSHSLQEVTTARRGHSHTL